MKSKKSWVAIISNMYRLVNGLLDFLDLCVRLRSIYCVIINNWFTVSVHLSRYGCMQKIVNHERGVRVAWHDR